MNSAKLLEQFDRLSEAPDAVMRLRRFILDLAVRGKLVEQNVEDEPATALLKRIETERAGLVKAGKYKEVKSPAIILGAPPIDYRKTGAGFLSVRRLIRTSVVVRHPNLIRSIGTVTFFGQASRM